jgi:hypothetical protein
MIFIRLLNVLGSWQRSHIARAITPDGGRLMLLEFLGKPEFQGISNP